MIKKLFLAITLTLLCAAMHGPVRAAGTFDAAEDALLRDFSRGDYHALWESLKTMEADHLTDPSSVLYYPDLADFADTEGYPETAAEMKSLLEKLRSEPESPDKNSRLLLFLINYEKLLSSFNRREAGEITKILSPVTAWKIHGPFMKNGPGDLDYAFLPELAGNTDIDGESRMIDTSNDLGFMDFSRYLFPAEGIAYATCSLSVDKPVKIRVYSPSHYRLFINGKPAATNGMDNFRTLRVIRVDAAGTISLTMKVQAGKEWKFRILLSDDRDIPVKPVHTTQPGNPGDFTFSEMEEYPFYQLQQELAAAREPRRRAALYRRMGMHCDIIEDRRSTDFYRKARNGEDTPVNRYFLALSLLNRSGGDRASWMFTEARRIFQSITDEDSAFLPARHRLFIGQWGSVDSLEAVRTGEKLIADNPRHLPSWLDLLALYDSLDYGREFHHTLALCKKEFPRATLPLLAEAAYLKKRKNPGLGAILRDILSRRYDPDTMKSLVEWHKSRGELKTLFSLHRQYEYDDYLHGEYIDALIRMGMYEPARQAIFRDIALRPLPRFYLKLGIIEYLNSYDATMYWHKVISMDPSFFALRDYMEYLSAGTQENPFAGYDRDAPPVEALFKNMESYSLPSQVMYRSQVFLLQRDGSSRVYCNEIIHLNDEKGLEKWGEYRVPFEGKLHPQTVRVHYADGTWNDSYRIETINRANYINLSSLKADSMIHLQYIVDNPLGSPRLSRHFALKETMLQDYDEPVKQIRVTVVSPVDMHLELYNSAGWKTTSEERDDTLIRSFEAKDLHPVYREYFSGSDLNCLPYFHFTSMRDENDLMSWYGGLADGMAHMENPVDIKGQNLSQEDIIRSVYNRVSREVFLQRNILYYPEEPDNTWYRKSGTVEDKVVLARAILAGKGIQSYIGLVRHSYLPALQSLANPELFSSVLLYIPLNEEKGYWLDFSSPYLPFGSVSTPLEGTRACLYIKNGTAAIKTVHSVLPDLKQERVSMTIDTHGNARCRFSTVFRGSYGVLKEHFRDRRYLENIISAYYGNMLSSLSIDHFGMENFDDGPEPFTIHGDGEALDFATMGTGRIILQPFISKSSLNRYIQYPERSHDLVISSPIREEDFYEITLPSQYRDAAVLKHRELTSTFGSADIHMEKKKGEDKLVIRKRVMMTTDIVRTQEYQQFLNFCMELNKLETQSLVLSVDGGIEP